MNATICVILSGLMLLMGIVDVRLRPTKRLLAFSDRSQDKPIMDPDHGSGRSFAQDKPRLDRFAKEMKENASNEKPADIAVYTELLNPAGLSILNWSRGVGILRVEAL